MELTEPTNEDLNKRLDTCNRLFKDGKNRFFWEVLFSICLPFFFSSSNSTRRCSRC